MSSDFAGQVVWVTGASSGIGAALARALAARGALLILSARREEKLRELRDTLATEALVLPLDLSDAASIPGVAEAALAWKGRVDLLINNAGVSQRSRVLDTSVDTARRVMEVNFFGAVALTAAVAPAMVARGQGHIVNMASVTAYLSAPERAFYSASKHAMRAWSNTLRFELSGDGVDVTIICPGYMRTSIGHAALDGRGSAVEAPDPKIANGMDPDAAAERMLPAIAARKREVFLGGVEVLGIYFNRILPGPVAWVMTDRVPSSDNGWMRWPRRFFRIIWGLPGPERVRTEPA